MKLLQQTSLVMLAGLISACGSSDNNSSGEGHEEHGLKILVSQQNSDGLSLLEEGELEALAGNLAGNGASLLLADNGEFAAALSTNQVNFIHGAEHEEEAAVEATEEHEEAELLAFSLAGTQVINSAGHFSILESGSTSFVAYDQLEQATPEVETLNLGVTETFPALILEEAEEVFLVFADDTATVYEAGSATQDTQACSNPTSAIQNEEYAVFTCTQGTYAVALEEGAQEHTIEFTDLSISGDYSWVSQGHVVVGLNQGNTNQLQVVEHDQTEALVASEINLTDGVCALALDSQDGDILVVNDNNQMLALNHEGETLTTISLDESNSPPCSAVKLASAAKTALVLDNDAQKLYAIDVDVEGGSYHIHERNNVAVQDVQSMVIFHDKEDAQAHDHSH